jgi:mRNA interferase HicA
MVTNDEKLLTDNEKFRTSPLLRKAGWYPERQSGSHIKLVHPNRTDFIIFPSHGAKEIGTGLEKKIRKQAGI